MVNNGACSVIDNGEVQIKMHYYIVRMLMNPSYVLELKKNLVSLSTLNSLDCSYHVEDGILTVSSSTLAVKKMKLKNGLYILKGSKVVGVALVLFYL